MKKIILILAAVMMIVTTASAFYTVNAEENKEPVTLAEVQTAQPAGTEDEELTVPTAAAPQPAGKDAVADEIDPDDEDDEIDEPDDDEIDEPDDDGIDEPDDDEDEQDDEDIDDPEEDSDENEGPEISDEVNDGSDHDSDTEVTAETPEAAEEPADDTEQTDETVKADIPEEKPEEKEEEPEDRIIHDAVTVVICGVQESFEYDGKDHEVNGYTVEDITHSMYSESDFTFTGEAVAKRVGSGVTYMGLSPEKFRNTNPDFDNVKFVVTDGFVQVDPTNAVVTIRGEQLSAPYDGETHMASGFSIVSINTPLYNASDFSFFGDASVERSEVGVSEMGLSSDQFENNNRNFDEVDFIVTDGFVEIKESAYTEPEDDLTEEEPEETEEEETGVEDGALTDGEPENSPAEEPVTEIPSEGEGSLPEAETAPAEETGEPAEGEAPAEGTEGEEITGEETGEPAEGEAPAEGTEGEEITGEEAGEPAEDEAPAEGTEGEETTGEETGEPAEGEAPAEGTEGEEATGEETGEPAEGEVPAEGTEGEEITGEETGEPAEGDVPAEGQEISGEETAAATVKVAAQTSVYAAADPESEVILITAEDAEYPVLSAENGWTNIQVNEETSGYISDGDIVTEEPVEEIAEGTDEKMIMITAGTNVRAAADGMSEIIFTAETDTEAELLGVEGEWAKVKLEDGTEGFIFTSDLGLGTETDVTAETPKKVTIFTSRTTRMKVGEMITLTSLLEGFENCTAIRYRWECDKGSGFEPVEGGDGDSYSYEASAESFGWTWRLIVQYAE